MDGVVDEVVPLLGARMPGDDLRPAADHHLVHAAPHQHLPVSLAARLRIDQLAVLVSWDYPAATVRAWCG